MAHVYNTPATIRLQDAARKAGYAWMICHDEAEGFLLTAEGYSAFMGRDLRQLGATEEEVLATIKGERVHRLVYGYVVGPREGQKDWRPEIVAHIERTGDCVWHACAVVTGSPCHCAVCQPGARFF